MYIVVVVVPMLKMAVDERVPNQIKDEEHKKHVRTSTSRSRRVKLDFWKPFFNCTRLYTLYKKKYMVYRNAEFTIKENSYYISPHIYRSRDSWRRHLTFVVQPEHYFINYSVECIFLIYNINSTFTMILRTRFVFVDDIIIVFIAQTTLSYYYYVITKNYVVCFVA